MKHVIAITKMTNPGQHRALLPKRPWGRRGRWGELSDPSFSSAQNTPYSDVVQSVYFDTEQNE